MKILFDENYLVKREGGKNTGDGRIVGASSSR